MWKIDSDDWGYRYERTEHEARRFMEEFAEDEPWHKNLKATDEDTGRVIYANAARSTNGIVAKALNAVARNYDVKPGWTNRWSGELKPGTKITVVDSPMRYGGMAGEVVRRDGWRYVVRLDDIAGMEVQLDPNQISVKNAVTRNGTYKAGTQWKVVTPDGMEITAQGRGLAAAYWDARRIWEEKTGKKVAPGDSRWDTKRLSITRLNADTSTVRETAVNGSDDDILRLCKQSNIIQRGKTEDLHEVRYGGGYIYPVVSRDGVLIKVYGSLSEANRRALNARNAEFKVGDRVRIKNPNRQIGQDDGTYEVTLIRPDGMISIKALSEKVGFAVRPEQLIANAARSRNDALGRYKPGVRVDVELRTRPIVGKVMQYGGRPEVEYSPTTRTRFTGTLIKQNGDKWDIKSDSGEVYKSVSEADFGLSYNSRSRNAVVQKALNARALNYSPYRKGAWLHDDKGREYTVVEEEHWGKNGGAERFVTIRDEKTKQTKEVAVTELAHRFDFGEATNAATARNAVALNWNFKNSYQFFCVDPSLKAPCILSGWDYREDAKDDAAELKEAGIPHKIVSRRFLEQQGIDPNAESSWKKNRQ